MSKWTRENSVRRHVTELKMKRKEDSQQQPQEKKELNWTRTRNIHGKNQQVQNNHTDIEYPELECAVFFLSYKSFILSFPSLSLLFRVVRLIVVFSSWNVRSIVSHPTKDDSVEEQRREITESLEKWKDLARISPIENRMLLSLYPRVITTLLYWISVTEKDKHAQRKEKRHGHLQNKRKNENKRVTTENE